jgi:hypothetical protein
MTQVKNVILRTALFGTFAALATTAMAQTAQPGTAPTDAGQMSMQAAPDASSARPPQQNLVAPAPTDPLVQKRNATAKANAEYRASKKASKEDLKTTNKEAKAQYKEQVRNAKINQKADKQAATNELNTEVPNGVQGGGIQH